MFDSFRSKNLFKTRLLQFLILFFSLIPSLVIFPFLSHKKVHATNVSANITTNTTWNAAGSPYNLTTNIAVNSGVVLTIDTTGGAVDVRSNGNFTLTINGTLSANGTVTNGITFQHNSSTTAGAWGGISVSGTGTANVSYSTIRYTNVGISATANGGTVNVDHSTFDTNNFGIQINNRAGLTTNTNSFIKNTAPLILFPDSITSSNLGTTAGGTADSLGTGANRNTYNGIFVNNGNVNKTTCVTACQISQKEFAGISNIPYILNGNLAISVSSVNFTVDAGVVIKAISGIFSVGSTTKFIVNGTSGNETIFTSVRDDRFGLGGGANGSGTAGDTNNDGTSTTPAKGNWTGFQVNSTASAQTITYGKFYYATTGVEFTQAGALSVSNSVFENNSTGLAHTSLGTLTTASNTFSLNSNPVLIYPIALAGTTFGTGGSADILSSTPNQNTINAILLNGANLVQNACPSDLCQFTQKTFAGITNIPYVMSGNLDFSGNADTVAFDAGVIIKTFNGRILIGSGIVIDVNGTSGNEVIFTSIEDDRFGTGGGAGGSGTAGDTGNDGTATSGAKAQWSGIDFSGTGSNTIDYAKIYYADNALQQLSSTQSVTLTNSVLDNATYAFEVDTSSGSFTTVNNTISNNTYIGVVMPAALEDMSFGSGGNVDTLTSNTNNVLLFNTGSTSDAACPSDICTILQLNIGNITNIPLGINGNYTFSGSNDTVVINAGVVIKGYSGSFLISNGCKLDINGTSTNRVNFTSSRDDSIGGDTNGDSTATTPAAGNWAGISIAGAGLVTLDFVKVKYATRGMDITGTSVAVTDSDFTLNTTGIYNNTTTSPTFTRVNIELNTSVGMDNNTTTVINAENLWWGSNAGPNDTDNAGQCTTNSTANNLVRDTATRPIDYCPFSTSKFNSNTLPTTTNVTLDSGAASVSLTANSTKNVVCTGRVTDIDGYTDINSVEARFYRSGVGSSGSADDNNRYILTGDSQCVPSGGSGTTEDYTCTFAVKFHAEPTDSSSPNSADNWTCLMTPTDGTGSGSTDQDNIEVNTLRAVSLSANITYGTLAVGADTGSTNSTLTVSNAGNSAIDFDMNGTNMCRNYPTCSGTTIPVANQQYSTSTFTYGAGTALSTSDARINASLTKPTTSPSNSSTILYFGIGVPFNVTSGAYEGRANFTAVADQ